MQTKMYVQSALLMALLLGTNVIGAEAAAKEDIRRPIPPLVMEPGPVIPAKPYKPIVPAPVVKNEKNIELVFVLDTTGSMGGLIQGAKDKIWYIVNDVLQHQKKGTKVRIGLVAYRDKGDDYITKETGLSEDLDKVYATLMEYKAQGGGDTPEDVRQALWKGVHAMQWSKSSSNLSKIVFLVGDAPPHTDYTSYPTTVATAKEAKKNGIIINTIQCGNLPKTDQYWRDIAQYGGGEYFAIAQNGGTRTIATPFDEKLRQLSTKLDSGYIPYGSSKERKASSLRAMETREKMATATDEAMADRAVNKGINSYSYSSNDLIQGIENGKIKLSAVKKADLPENMQKMTEAERIAYVNGKIQERKDIRAEILKVSGQRTAYIRTNTTESAASFDQAVARALAKQIK